MAIQFESIPLGDEMVAEAGNWGLFQTTVILKRTSNKQGVGNNLHVIRQELLPSPKEYITINAAHNKSGLSEKELTLLCSNGVLEAKKVKGKWLINSSSLEKYIATNP
jgi:hypothetical protein